MPQPITTPALEDYAAAHTTPEPEYLRSYVKLNDGVNAKTAAQDIEATLVKALFPQDAVREGEVRFNVAVPGPDEQTEDYLEMRISEQLQTLEWIREVELGFAQTRALRRGCAAAQADQHRLREQLADGARDGLRLARPGAHA